MTDEKRQEIDIPFFICHYVVSSEFDSFESLMPAHRATVEPSCKRRNFELLIRLAIYDSSTLIWYFGRHSQHLFGVAFEFVAPPKETKVEQTNFPILFLFSFVSSGFLRSILELSTCQTLMWASCSHCKYGGRRPVNGWTRVQTQLTHTLQTIFCCLLCRPRCSNQINSHLTLIECVWRICCIQRLGVLILPNEKLLSDVFRLSFVNNDALQRHRWIHTDIAFSFDSLRTHPARRHSQV